MANEKKRLESLLKKLNAEIQNQQISSEEHVVNLFRIRDQGQMAMFKILGAGDASENTTILEILGWNAATVEDHPVKKTVVGQINFSPDYVLKSEQKILAIIDLKGPDVNLDKWFGQISSYCQHLNVPLGILFNGREMRVLINTNIKSFQTKSCKRYKELFDKRFVASAEFHNPKQLVDLLLRFSFSSLECNATAVAKKLAREAVTIITTGERQKKIRRKTQEILANPSEELLKSMATLSVWQDIEPLPTDVEIATAWHSQTTVQPSVPTAPSKSPNAIPINLVVRQKIAEVCKQKGSNVLEAAQVKGLRLRSFGGNGYHLVPQTQGVPIDLYAQGMSSGNAQNVIKRLEELLDS